MSTEALRTVFAELGFEVDLKSLEAANKVVDKAVAKARELVGATEKVDKAEEQAAKGRKKRAAEQAKVPAVAAAVPPRPEGPASTTVGGVAYSTNAWKAHIESLQQQAAAQAKVQEDIAAAQAKHKGKAFGFKGPEPKQLGGRSKEWEAAKKVDTKGTETLAKSLGQVHPALGKVAEMAGVGEVRLSAFMMRAAVVAGVLHQVASAAFAFAAGFTAEAEALRETAREARVTSSELQALQHAGAQSGVGADRVTRSITAFGNKLRDANNRMAGGSGVSSTLRRMGISMRDASGQVRPTVELLGEVAVAMEHISSPRRRIQVAQQLGLDQRMLDILHTGAGGIRALMEETARYGGGIAPEATEAARKYAQAQEHLRLATTSVRSVLFTALAPALGWVIEKAALATGWFARMTRGTNVFKIVLIGLGAVAVAALAPVAAAVIAATWPFLLAAAAVALLVLAIDDVVTTFQGGDSILGRFLDRLGGVGTRTRFVRDMAEAWEGVQLAVNNAGADIRAFYDAVSGFLSQLGGELSQFGTDMASTFTGAWDTISGAFGRVWDAITARVTQFFGFVGGGVRDLARALGMGEVADALSPLLDRAREGVSGAVNAVSEATGAGAAAGRVRQTMSEYSGALGLVEDLVNPVAIARNAVNFYGGMGTGNSTQQVVGAPIPATRNVSAGGGRGRGGSTHHQTVQMAPGAIQVTGVTDPRRAAELVATELQRRARQARDGATPAGEER